MNPAKRRVSTAVLEAARKAADQMMDRDPELREHWLDQVRTSTTSRDIGVVDLQTDYDWILAFFAWYHGMSDQLPREEMKRRKVS